MKTFLFFLLVLNRSCSEPAMVYVCDSPNARRYHLKADCRGLSNCSYRTLKITLAEAQKEGKTLCHWENKTMELKKTRSN